ncbi:MAG: SIR2 family protein [Patescibacteria group bacterium]|nr:SIR2 family protein [Patescibacteria group bacterium]
MQFKDVILLAGAGFTKDYGGFLGDEMWGLIFNHPSIQKNELLHKLFLGGQLFDFEDIYSEVNESTSFNIEQKNGIKEATFAAYSLLDKILIERIRSTKVDGLVELIRIFKGDPGKPGVFFTLNQDLFVERQIAYRLEGGLQTLGVNHLAGVSGGRKLLDMSDFLTLPNSDKVKNIDISNYDGLLYVKLHGSWGWNSAVSSNRAMAIGYDKSRQIIEEPLLNFYYEKIFINAITFARKVLIIGYSFRDKDINNVLWAGIQRNLKLYVIDKLPPKAFRDHLNDGIYYSRTAEDVDPSNLWDALAGYYPYRISDLVSGNNSNYSNSLFHRIRESLV